MEEITILSANQNATGYKIWTCIDFRTTMLRLCINLDKDPKYSNNSMLNTAGKKKLMYSFKDSYTVPLQP